MNGVITPGYFYEFLRNKPLYVLYFVMIHCRGENRKEKMDQRVPFSPDTSSVPRTETSVTIISATILSNFSKTSPSYYDEAV